MHVSILSLCCVVLHAVVIDAMRHRRQIVAQQQVGPNGVNFFPPALAPLDKFVPVYLAMPVPSVNNAGGPTVIPIVLGSMGDVQKDFYNFPSSVTLVRDGADCDILIDTGVALYKNTIVGGLAAHGIKLTDIDNVILTHNDFDNMGNLNLFYGTRILTGNKQIVRDTVYEQSASPQFRPGVDLPSREICSNTDVYFTPGFGDDDLSVVVRNVRDFGTIAIVGNLIMNEATIGDASIWMRFSPSDAILRDLWRNTEREIICLADYIIPGHGETFRVTSAMKSNANCGAGQSNVFDMLVKTE